MRSILTLAPLVLSLAFGSIGPAAAKAADGGSLICGGVGSDGRRALEGEAEGANLALEFFNRKGEYVTDVEVTLTSSNESDPGFAMTAEGPLCFMQVPPGRYRVEATFNGVRKVARADVPASPRKPVHVAVAFPEASSP